MKTKFNGRSGFSLLEIIVAVSIILVLALIAINTTGRLFQSAELNRCSANIRHAGIALIGYAAEQNNVLDVFAGGQNGEASMWGRLLYDNGMVDDKSIFRCEQGEATLPLTHGAWAWYTYGMNLITPPGAYVRYNSPDGRFERRYRVSLNAITNPSRHMLLFDSGMPSSSNIQSFRMEYSSKSGIKLRHEGKANVFFIDGHLRAMNRQQIVDNMELSEHENPNWNYIFD